MDEQPAYIKTVHVERSYTYTVHGDGSASPASESSPGYTVREETSTSYAAPVESQAQPSTGEHGPQCRDPDVAYMQSPHGIVKIVEAVSDFFVLII